MRHLAPPEELQPEVVQARTDRQVVRTGWVATVLLVAAVLGNGFVMADGMSPEKASRVFRPVVWVATGAGHAWVLFVAACAGLAVAVALAVLTDGFLWASRSERIAVGVVTCLAVAAAAPLALAGLMLLALIAMAASVAFAGLTFFGAAALRHR
jgi:hypothetical protein